MRKIISVLILVLLLGACSPQKRLARLIKNHPELKNTEYIYFRDTIYIKEFTADTAFSSKFDTVILDNERLTVMVVNRDSLIYLKATSKADTIFIEKNIPFEKINIIKEKKSFLFWFQVYLLGIATSIILFGLIKIIIFVRKVIKSSAK